MRRVIECVPNFSEGRDEVVIAAIVEAISGTGREGNLPHSGGMAGEYSHGAESQHPNVMKTQCPDGVKAQSPERVKVLNVDRGEGANRTVITFVGSPETVAEAAFRGVRKAVELIDMRKHKGTHPRSGACDVLPLIPVSGITLEECAGLSRGLAKRIYEELGVPCYCYEAAALRPSMRALSACRAGEWEALPWKISDPSLRPDFGPLQYNDIVAKSGACNVGAREFMLAVNFNLNSSSVRIASEIAAELRESGKILREGEAPGPPGGKVIRKPGLFKRLKAIGWYIEEYGRAQVSMNIYDLKAAPLHEVFEAVKREALKRGVKATGTEIIGLVPKSVLIEAGKYYLSQEGVVAGEEPQLIAASVKGLGLSDLRPFKPEEKVLEYLMEGRKT